MIESTGDRANLGSRLCVGSCSGVFFSKNKSHSEILTSQIISHCVFDGISCGRNAWEKKFEGRGGGQNQKKIQYFFFHQKMIRISNNIEI